jgi:hypothetical protein
MKQRYAKLEIEKAGKVGTEASVGEVMATPFYLPATEVGLLPNPDLLDRSDEISGVEGRRTGAQNDYGPTGSLVSRSYTRYLGALLAILFGEVESVEGDGVAVKDPDGVPIPKKAFRHLFKKKSGATPRSARLVTAYYDKWLEARGMTINSLAFALADDGVKATAQTMANFLTRLAVDPEDEVKGDPFAVLPFRRRNVTLSTPSLAATVLLNSIDFSMEQTLEPVRPMGIPSGFPQATERANNPEGFLRLQGSLTRRDFDSVDWDALISAAIFGIRFHFESEQPVQGVEGGEYPYSMWVETEGAQFTGGGPETLKQQARHESNYDWQAGAGEAGDQDFTVTVVNDVPKYIE